MTAAGRHIYALMVADRAGPVGDADPDADRCFASAKMEAVDGSVPTAPADWQPFTPLLLC